MVSKLLTGRGLGLQVSCQSFPTVYYMYISNGKRVVEVHVGLYWRQESYKLSAPGQLQYWYRRIPITDIRYLTTTLILNIYVS